jgi:hypothetical protein
MASLVKTVKANQVRVNPVRDSRGKDKVNRANLVRARVRVKDSLGRVKVNRDKVRVVDKELLILMPQKIKRQVAVKVLMISTRTLNRSLEARATIAEKAQQLLKI